MDPQVDPKVASVVKGIALTENGGKIPVDSPKAGQSGELKSIFQFTPGTWKMYAKEVLGKDIPISPEAEATVVYHKVDKWLKDGFTPDQIASIWNSGKPDAYLQNHRGVNSYGVKYDTPGYVKKFNQFLNEAENKLGGDSKSPKPLLQLPHSVPQPQQPSQTNTLPQLMQKNMKQVREI